MPLGLNRTDLNVSGTSYLTGNPITLPHNFGNPVTLPVNDGNPIPTSGTEKNIVNWSPSPAHFGNIFGAQGPSFSFSSPDSGPTAGGTPITIFGTGFVSGTAVSIGGQPATSVVVVSSTEITAVTPAGAQGLTDISLSNSSGSVDTSNAFLYADGGSVTLTISAAQMLALHTSPVQVVAGIPGAVALVSAGFLIYNPGTVQYTTGPQDVFLLNVGPRLVNEPLTNYVGLPATGFVDGTGGFGTDKLIEYWAPTAMINAPVNPSQASIPSSDLVGASIYLTQYDNTSWPSGANWTGGNGTLTLFVEYGFVKG